jgi:hypothetical protein
MAGVTFHDLRHDVTNWKTKDILMFNLEVDREIKRRVAPQPPAAQGKKF